MFTHKKWKTLEREASFLQIAHADSIGTHLTPIRTHPQVRPHKHHRPAAGFEREIRRRQALWIWYHGALERGPVHKQTTEPLAPYGLTCPTVRPKRMFSENVST